MAHVTIDPIQKLKAQVADQKDMIRSLKATIRDNKQALKDQKVSLQSAWQLEIEAHAEHALSVGYELGYLEAMTKQKEAMRQLKRDCEALRANLELEPSVDYSALDSVLSSAVGQQRVVPMPEPIPAVLVEPAAPIVEAVVEDVVIEKTANVKQAPVKMPEAIQVEADLLLELELSQEEA